MQFKLVTDLTRLQYVSVTEYSQNVKNILSVPGMDIYLARQVLCMGQEGGQCLLPIKPGEMDTVFLESFRHKHSFEAPAMSYVYGLLNNNDLAVVDEAVPLFPVWGTNFWHWIFESLPALLIMEKAGYKGQYIIPDVPFCLELTDMFGIARERILFSGKYYVIKNAIIPKLGHGRALNHAHGLVQLLRENFLDSAGVLPDKKFTYIRRGSSRRIINEEELLEVLRRYDFETYTPETQPVREQFRFMTNSVLTLMPHGANLALTLTKPEHSVLIECFSFALVDYCCLPTVNYLNLLYFAIPQAIGGETINKTSNASDWQDFTVNIDMVAVMLKNIFSRKALF